MLLRAASLIPRFFNPHTPTKPIVTGLNTADVAQLSSKPSNPLTSIGSMRCPSSVSMRWPTIARGLSSHSNTLSFDELPMPDHMRGASKEVLTLFKEYKSGVGFDLKSPWYKMGYKMSTDFQEAEFPHTVFVLYLVITKLDLWHDILKGPGKDGYFLSSPPSLKAVYAHPAVRAAAEKDGHTGLSFAQCMRKIQYMANCVVAAEKAKKGEEAVEAPPKVVVLS